jgi:GLPGLI family protein
MLWIKLNKMKKTTIIFLIFVLKIYSQNIESNFASIDYTFTSKVGGKFINIKTNLKCNSNKSFFQVSSKQEKDVKTRENETEIHIVSKSKDLYYIHDVKTKILDIICEAGGKDYKVKESFPPMNWVLSTDNKEVKKINDYTCNKATLNFRGRNYIAWYTAKIPVSFGPFKFRGLPGLILEIYDVSNEYIWTATKITYPLALKVDLGFINKLKPIEITLKQWIEKLKKERELNDKLILKKMPKGVVVESVKSENHSIELKYEWEVDEPKKKK